MVVPSRLLRPSPSSVHHKYTQSTSVKRFGVEKCYSGLHMENTSLKTRSRLTVVAIGVLLTVLASFVMRVELLVAWENTAYVVAPSAERAYHYGSRHFDAVYPSFYDIERAEYFFEETRKRDSSHIYVHHQLARIAFLRGDFEEALTLVETQIALHGESVPSSFYVGGLILGFMERYAEAAESFEAYLEHAPNNWAAVNDYAWVLLKDARSEEALAVLEELLNKKQENAWLLNSAAIAAYETGDFEKALDYIERASEHVENVTKEKWLTAYPGNDPRVAEEGIAALKEAIARTMHSVSQKVGDSALQSE